jgi:rare lipoprotein A
LSSNRSQLVLILAALLLFGSCGGKKTARVSAPAPPPPAESQPANDSSSTSATPRARIGSKTGNTTSGENGSAPDMDSGTEAENNFNIPQDTQPVFVQTGKASWYGPPYHNHRASNGEIFDMNAMTAAHLTLPLGSIVRVTNVKTGGSTMVRINDRGPFVEGRILDLSLAAAKKIDIWRAGVAEVKVEVLKTPSPLDSGGRWCVQIGSLEEEDAAAKLQDHLQRRYHSAQVTKFLSPVGVWWVRVRVAQDDRERAQELARETQPQEGSVFLVRLD